MATTNIGKLSATATLDASGFAAGADKIKQEAKGLAGTLSSIFQSTWGKVAAGAGTLLAIEYAIKSYVKAGLDSVKTQEKFAGMLGLTAAQAAGFNAILGQAGGSIDDMGQASTFALRNIAELRESLASGGGGGAAGASLRAMGLDPQEFANMSNFADQLAMVANGLKKVENAADRAAIGHAIFGRGYQAFLPLLRAGGDGMARYAQLAEQLGVAVGGSAREAMLGATKAAKDFEIVQRLAAEGLRNQFSAGFINATNTMQNYAAATREIINLQPRLAEEMRKAGEVAGAAAGGIESFFVKLLAGLREWVTLARGMLPPVGGQSSPTRINDELASRRSIVATMQRQVQEAQRLIDAGGGLDAIRQREEAWRRLAAAEINLENAQAAAGITPNATPGIKQIFEAGSLKASFASATQAGNAVGQQAVRNAISEATDALRRQNEVYGLTAEEAQRLRFIQQKASKDQLKEFDAEIARREQNLQRTRDQQQAEQQMARTRQMAQEARTPFEVIRDRMAEINASGLNRQQRGALLGRLFPSLGEAPLLGSLSAGGSDVGAILQGAMSPQIDRLTEIQTILEAMRQDNGRIADENKRIADALQDFINN